MLRHAAAQNLGDQINYKLRGISLERLMQALKILGQHVRIVVLPSKGRSTARIDVAA